jgi:hypothetical protein
MDDQHVVTLVEAVHGADFNAIGIFAFDAGFSDDVSHPKLRNGSIFSGLRSAGTALPQVEHSIPKTLSGPALYGVKSPYTDSYSGGACKSS